MQNPSLPRNEPIRKQSVEELKRQWKTFNLYEEDPLQRYFFEIDYQMAGMPFDEYWKFAQTEDPKKMTSLLIESWKWRADCRMNVVQSTEGTQGSGKSLSNIYFGLVLGKIFDRPFSLRDIAFYPEEMEKAIEHSQTRQTIMCDEQQTTNVGLMSSTIRNRLVDYEEQLRFSMTNLLYVAPALRSHQHYYVLETWKPVRIKNRTCILCKKSTCIDCEIPEERRSGYPAFFVLMLKTKRAQDGMLVPRGYVLAKMPPKKIIDEYEIIKQEHIRKLKAKESMRWEFLKKLAEEVWHRGQNTILKQTKTGRYIVAPQKIIKMLFYEMHGMNYLPRETEELLLTMVTERAREHIVQEELNEEEEEVVESNEETKGVQESNEPKD